MGQDQITIRNPVPRFLAFCRLAKTLLECAWDRYPQAIPALEAWAPGADAASRYLTEVKAALDCQPAPFRNAPFLRGRL